MMTQAKLILALLISTASFSIVRAKWSKTGEAFNPKDKHYGTAIAISPRFLAIGAPLDDSNFGDTNTGVVHIYDREGKMDGLSLELTSEILGYADGEKLGFSLDVSADSKTIVVGAPQDDQGINDPGLVKVFRYDDAKDDWGQLGGNFRGKETSEKFGKSVSISDDGLVVCIGAGSGGDDDLGRVDVYMYKNHLAEGWEYLGPIAGKNEVGSRFGRSIDVIQKEGSDEYFIAISSPKDDNDRGMVEVFHVDQTNAHYNWKQVGRHIRGRISYDEFGRDISLGMSEDVLFLAIGIPAYGYYSDAKHEGSSRVEVYRFDMSAQSSADAKETEWKMVESVAQIEDDDGTGEVVELSRDGSRLAVGSPKHNNFRGVVRVFDFHAVDDAFYAVGEDLMEGRADYEGFGTSLSLSGNDLAISAPYGKYVEIYTFNAGSGGSSFVTFLWDLLIGIGACGLLLLAFWQAKRRGLISGCKFGQGHSPVTSHDANIRAINEYEAATKNDVTPFPLRASSTKKVKSDSRAVENIGGDDYEDDLEMKQYAP